MHAVFGVAQWAIRVRLEHLIADKGHGHGIGPGWRGENIGFGGMHQALAKFMVAGDMVEVAMAGHRQQRFLGEPGQLLTQADQARAGVDQHIALAALHMPHIAAVEGPYIGFVDQLYAVIQTVYCKPLFACDDFHVVLSTGWRGSPATQVQTRPVAPWAPAPSGAGWHSWRR